tara:strand:+ start:14 stop:193 length:180 start_codon:yes stop_codon:yes gene_type:complete
MSKRARDPKRTTDAEKHPMIYKISKKYGRSRGPLVMGLNGVMVTQKVLQAQKRNRKIDD